MLLLQMMASLSLLIIVLSWLRMGEHKSTKKKSEKEIKLNIKRLLLLSQWVLLVHEGPSGARIPAEMRPWGWFRGRESFSWTWTLFSQQSESSILCLAVFIPLAVNGIFAFIILSSSVKEHKKAEWERGRASHFTADVALKDNAIWPIVPVVIVISIIYWAEWAGDEV